MSVISGTVGAVMGSKASSKAASEQYKATKYAMDKYKEMFDISRQAYVYLLPNLLCVASLGMIEA